MKAKLEAVYSELKYLKKIINQEDLGNKLGYNKGYTSQIMNGKIELNDKIKQSFNKVFGINLRYWDSEDAPMFETPSDTKHPKSHPEPKGSILEYMLETGKEYAKKMIDIGKYPTAKDIADLEELAKKIEQRKKSGE